MNILGLQAIYKGPNHQQEAPTASHLSIPAEEARNRTVAA